MVVVDSYFNIAWFSGGPSLKHLTIFDENLIGIHMKKQKSKIKQTRLLWNGNS